MNSFSAIAKAIDYEIERQKIALEAGEPIVQETRLWEEGAQRTISMRVKEGSSDYRYFPEPDLTPIVVGAERMEKWRQELPELPRQKRQRYEQEFGLSPYDARVLTDDREVALYLEATIAAGADAKQAANWVMGDITSYLKTQKVSIETIALRPENLAELIGLIEKGTINGKIAKEILPELLANGGSVQKLVESKGMTSLSDPSAIGALIDEIIAANPKELEQYRAGKTKLLGFFVGQVMKQSGGRAEPKLTNQILNEKLNG
jgi:aspartyl-tRNA(Asn)/glutamyl-tRNA(Gln) amidotransferase subunit B